MSKILIALLLAVPLFSQKRSKHVAPQALAQHVSFLSSDALEGRRSPSKGLDAAAAYIASWFRRFGLEAPIEGGYFQVARPTVRRQPLDGFQLVLEQASTQLVILPTQISGSLASAASIKGAPIYKLEMNDANSADTLTEDDVRDRVLLLVPKPGVRTFTLMRKISTWKTAVTLIIDPSPYADGFGTPRLARAQPGSLRLHTKEAADFAAALPNGLTTAKATLHASATIEETVEVRNVLGILRGSDPKLKDSFILVSAHYDHLGRQTSGPGDLVFHGANDDASGVAAMLEIAGALTGRRPRRSILFAAFYGEEDGLVGSRYYGQHPIVPIEKMAGQINLEQLGRTDVDDEKELAAYNLTGFDFTNLNITLSRAAKRHGVRIFKKDKMSDPFFAQSDNQSMANLGVPSTTASVGYMFPDYHQRTDTWEKLDYSNLAKITDSLADGVLAIARDKLPPQWNEKSPDGKKYAEIRKNRK